MHRKFMFVFVALLALGALAAPGFAQDEVTISHYFSGELNQDNLNTIVSNFQEMSGISVIDSPIGHEDFKTGILAGVAAGVLPDLFSYWAGARVQFVVDAGALQPIDDLWDAAGLDDVVPAGVAGAATMYNGSRYFIPFNIHYAAFFYNPKVWAEAGIDVPDTWAGLLEAFAAFEAQGIDPIALGSQYRWPGQFWFDYLLLRTAGPDYRAALMAGDASYEDAEVVHAMSIWQSLIDAGYFVDDANAYDWVDAADQVANGEAAVTLMGTWIGGYWKGQDLVPGEDYDFFDFPPVHPHLHIDVPQAGVGPIDGWVMTTPAPIRLPLAHSSNSSSAMWIRRRSGTPAMVRSRPTSMSTRWSTTSWRPKRARASPTRRSTPSTMTWLPHHRSPNAGWICSPPSWVIPVTSPARWPPHRLARLKDLPSNHQAKPDTVRASRTTHRAGPQPGPVRTLNGILTTRLAHTRIGA